MKVITGIIIALLFLVFGIFVEGKTLKRVSILSAILTLIATILCVATDNIDLLEQFILLGIVFVMVIDTIAYHFNCKAERERNR